MLKKIKAFILVSLLSLSLINVNQVKSMDLIKSGCSKVSKEIVSQIKDLFSINSLMIFTVLYINPANLLTGIHSADPELKKIFFIGFLYLLKRQLKF